MGLSAGLTHVCTSDLRLAAVVGGVAAVATWLGVGTVIVCDD